MLWAFHSILYWEQFKLLRICISSIYSNCILEILIRKTNPDKNVKGCNSDNFSEGRLTTIRSVVPLMIFFPVQKIKLSKRALFPHAVA